MNTIIEQVLNMTTAEEVERFIKEIQVKEVLV